MFLCLCGNDVRDEISVTSLRLTIRIEQYSVSHSLLTMCETAVI